MFLLGSAFFLMSFALTTLGCQKEVVRGKNTTMWRKSNAMSVDAIIWDQLHFNVMNSACASMF